MPISRTTKLFAVEDAKIAKLTADVTTAPTYDVLIDVPGIRTVNVGFDINSVELRGDNKQLDSDSTLGSVTVSFEHAKLSLDALAVMIGGTTVDSGVAPNQKATFTRTGTNAFSYFKFEGKTPTNGVDTPGGDAHLLFHKCKVTAYTLGFGNEDYQILSGTFKGVYTISNDKLFDVILNETTAAIA